MEWQNGSGGLIEINQLLIGLPYSFSILFFLASHEFGHYFASRYHKVDATLPYFIPFISFFGVFLNFGTLGAVIRTKSEIPNKKALFDIGVSGPLAGFVACLIILVYGFTHLPGRDFIVSIHPDYFMPKHASGGLQLAFGDTLLFSTLRYIFTSPGTFIPPMSEIYHYPFLCVGWFGLFVTSMNMVPVGQLDGGHIIYAMFGKKNHELIAGISMILLILLGVLGVLQMYVYTWITIGWAGWLFWATVLFFILKIQHPPIGDMEPLDKKRKIIGYIALFVFVLCFSPSPFSITF
ncbi:MAG: site-2 protease family protein [Ignavibacteriales bacterium]|nr:site-2 protease family protein [Ignavibacteriales bacterium]